MGKIVTENIIYFDNAATSWPKPEQMLEAIRHYTKLVGGSPGRSAHSLSITAGRLIADARESISKFFNFYDTSRIIFTKNITEGLNICLRSLLKKGDIVLTSTMEHNSVMRPLRFLEQCGVKIIFTVCKPNGSFDFDDFIRKINKKIKLIVLTHASNVTGTIFPISKIAEEARKNNIPFLIDGAQTAGAIPLNINFNKYTSCIFAFTGHKSLLGPSGTGGICIGSDVDINPLIFGGTGSRSDYDIQPDFLPDKLESGTLNILGISGLKASIDFLLEKGIQNVRNHEKELTDTFIQQAQKSINKFKIYGTLNANEQVGLVSFNINNMSPSKVGLILDRKYNIMCRIGLHCNPNAHKTINTFPDGTVRFGFSLFNTMDEIKKAILALKEISEIED